MSTGHWLDDVAKTLARGRSRRDVLRGLGTTIAAAMFAAVSPRTAAANDCVDLCRNLGRTGRDFGECVADCERGLPITIQCGGNVCDALTEFCCNESCGICAPIGGFCIQIVCGPTP